MTLPSVRPRLPLALLSWMLILALVIPSGCASCRREGAKLPPAKRITLLTFNDFHGAIVPFTRFYGDKEQSGGVARLAALVKQIRTENEAQGADTLLLFGGDMIQGTPISTAFKGDAEVEAFNQLKVDASVVGNHDFDYGLPNLLRLQKLAQFPILSANIYDQKTDARVFEALLHLKTPHGLKVGVIGLTTDETPITTHPNNVKDLRFVMPSLAMRKHAAELKKGNDLLVVLSHAGVKDDRDLARDFPEIHVIVGGHTHTMLADPLHIGKALISQTGDRGLHLGRMDLEVVGKEVRLLSSSLIPIRDHLAEDPEMKALVAVYVKRLEVEVGKSIGVNLTLLNGERNIIRTQETNLGDLIADLMRLRGKAQVAFINSGAIRSSIQPGVVTLGAVMDALPMNNTLYTFELTGAQLTQVVQHSIEGLLAGGLDKPFGGFLQISGMQVVMRGDKLESLLVDGAPVNPHQKIRCASIDFLMAGGDGYEILKEARQIYDTGVNLRDLLLSAMSPGRPLNVRNDTRFVRF